MTLLVDAGPLYAYYDADDKHHAACLALLDGDPGPLVVPTLAVTEVAYLVGRRRAGAPRSRCSATSPAAV